jgi:hypothetical protein
MARGQARKGLPRSPVLGLGDPDLQLLYDSLRYHGGLSSDPADAREGELWLRSDLDPVELRGVVGGAAINLLASSGGVGTVSWADVTDTPTTLAEYGIMDAVADTDPRLTDARNPTSHATSHEAGGNDLLDLDSVAGELDGDKIYGSLGATSPLNDITALAATFGSVEVAGTLLPSATGINMNSLNGGNPPMYGIPSGSGLVANFNADLLDGQHDSYYLSRVNHTGTQDVSTLVPGGDDEVLFVNGGDPTWGLLEIASLSTAALANLHNASNLNAGTLDDARLSANVALENVSNVFTTAQFIRVATSGSNALTLAYFNGVSNVNGWKTLPSGSQTFYATDGTTIDCTLTHTPGSSVLVLSGGFSVGTTLNLPGIGTGTTATAGAATLPANPVGFITVSIAGTSRRIPYYAA